VRAIDSEYRRTQLTSPFVYNQLQTTDPSRAKEFYRELFGWTLLDDPPSAGPAYTEVLVKDERIAGIMQKREGSPPQWMPYIAVDDVDAATEKARSLGAAVIVPPMDIPPKGCRISMLTDPAGVAFAVRSVLTPRNS
jgi:predicted enzyme related to lactoylglutathione lyase